MEQSLDIPEDTLTLMTTPNTEGWIQLGKFYDPQWAKLEMPKHCAKVKKWSALVLYLGTYGLIQLGTSSQEF